MTTIAGARWRWIALLLATLALPGAAGVQERAANLLRLQSMPLPFRQELARRLKTFLALPEAEQSAIRAIDDRIGELDPLVRTRYLTVLRQYHLWLRTLTAKQREELAGLAVEERTKRVEALLLASTPPSFGAYDFRAATSPALNPLPLLDQAHAIRIWFKLNPDQKKDVNQSPAARRILRLEQLGTELGVEDDRRSLLREIENRARGTRLQPAAKKLQGLQGKSREEAFRRMYDTALLNRSVGTAAPRELERFVLALPTWLRESFDDLPPAAARQRLTVLHGLVFPDGEMPTSIQPDSPATPAKPKSAPTIPSGVSPF